MRVVFALVAWALVAANASAAEAIQVRPAVRTACDSVFSIRSFDELRVLFGEPLQHEIKSGRDQHSGQYQVEQHDATFATAQAWYAIAEAIGPSIQWQRFTVSKPGARIPPQAWIGQTLAQVSTSLGPPDRVAGDRAYYDCDETRGIVLLLESEEVSVVEWLGYLD